MGRSYEVIDSDGHVLEPPDLWQSYIDPAYREDGPRVVVDDNGKERMLIEGKLLGSAGGISGIGAVGRRQGLVSAEEMKTLRYVDGRRGGFDPHARIIDMDLDEIDAVFLYPSLGLYSGAIESPKLAGAVCRAYNRWLADYCAPYPDRLFGVAMLPMQDLQLAMDEIRFARNELGMRAGFLRPNPQQGRALHDSDYNPLWEVAQDLDFAIGIHEGGNSGMATVGIERFDSRGAKHMVSHTLEMMLAAVSVIWNGVCDRFPGLRIGFMESGGGWIAPWLDRMDRHYTDPIFNDTNLSMSPTELFQRNCWISFEPVERGLNVLADYIGPNKILWATDYPHGDGFFPGAPKLISERPELSAETKRGILSGGAKAFYGLSS